MLNLAYERGYNGNIAQVRDRSTRQAAVPRLDASYGYDRLNQLVRTDEPSGRHDYRYDANQALAEDRALDGAAGEALTEYRYGESDAPLDARTRKGDETVRYDALGRLEAYHGWALRFDAEAHLVEASRPERTLSFYYGPGGERELVLDQVRGQAPRVQRYVFDEYQELDGEPHWLVDVAGATAEVIQSEGVRVDARLVDELSQYLHGTLDVKPLPAELMDLDGQGDGLTQADLDLAARALWSEQPLGVSGTVWRFSHADQLGSHTHATDSVGDLVALQAFEAYGSRRVLEGRMPARGYAGVANRAEQELGLLLFGARYYAPELHRWISPDLHIGTSPPLMFEHVLEANLYSYASNNPVHHRDPTGQATGDGSALMSAQPAAAQASADDQVCEWAFSDNPYADLREQTGQGAVVGSHDVYDKNPKKNADAKVVYRPSVYNSEFFVHARSDAQTDIDGWRLADFYDHANVGPGAVKCKGGPCKISSGVGQGLGVIATTLARDPRLKASNPDRYVSPIEYNYTTLPGKSNRKGRAFAGVQVGDAVVIRYKDRVVYGFVGDIGNSFKFGENALRTNVELGFKDEVLKVRKGKYRILGHDARDVEYIYLKNTAHLLRDKDGVLLPQAQIDRVVKGLYEHLLGPVAP